MITYRTSVPSLLNLYSFRSSSHRLSSKNPNFAALRRCGAETLIFLRNPRYISELAARSSELDSVSCSSEVNDDGGDGEEEKESPAEGPEEVEESFSGDGVDIAVTKVGRNMRRVDSRIRVGAGLEEVWGVLTDYEALADVVPSLTECSVVERGENFSRLCQVGQQNLGFGLKFNARGVLDCYEKELEHLPFGRRRDVEFKMIEGDFRKFEGRWSILEVNANEQEGGEFLESQTVLTYTVELEPRPWLPVRLLEGIICREVKVNLMSIREEAQRAHKRSCDDSLT
ncbi:hypothetical protein QJS10_CPA16g01800 [Acorus calamus]|uniref:Coenzyme Q-binding protein COQ10 START domain-containing protein n=1 Tax=Acorus calamus TaxID=4465 RepID=A0AAV9CYJ0_ACOCL|nr:hypothetical protein QJS10_CPA16g01800 [Acorus calamus]